METETKVAELEALREEKRLESTVKKPADAAAYEARVQAEGQREARIALAEAAKRETELKAEADARRVELAAAADAKRVELAAAAQATQTREVGQAEADATQARGQAEGEAVRAKGLAEAEAIGKRAEALAAESEAVIGQQLAEKLPEIVAAAAGAFRNVDNLTVLNGAQGISEIMNQVIGQAGPTLALAQAGARRRRQRRGPRRAGCRRVAAPPRRGRAGDPVATTPHRIRSRADRSGHRLRHPLDLPRLVAQRPQVDAVASGVGVPREELGAMGGGPDADLRAELGGIPPQQRSQDVGEDAVALRAILRHPGPHRRERVREAVRRPPAVLERARRAVRAPEKRSGVVL